GPTTRRASCSIRRAHSRILATSSSRRSSRSSIRRLPIIANMASRADSRTSRTSAQIPARADAVSRRRQEVRMRLLITGGAGCLGANIVERYLGREAEIVVIDNFATSARDAVAPSANLKIVDGTVA